MAALIRPLGRTADLLFGLEEEHVYIPETLLEELEKYLLYVTKKRKEDVETVKREIDLLLKDFKRVGASKVKSYLEEAKRFVRDKKDAPFVATALYLLRFYQTIIILTFNKKDYKLSELQKHNIRVLSPDEL